MPINQPTRARIDASDFQNSSYSFAVESVIDAKASPGRLVVSASRGYLLTSSLSDQPRREQTFDHKQQADGSWLAAGTITLTLSNDKVIDGKVTIQNSLAEFVVLTVAAISMAVERSQTALAINQPSLAFAPTIPGKPSYLVLTVTPQQADTPITLTTDATDLFQLATDSHPHFKSKVTFNPSPNGSYVHVRYMANKRGVHTGLLLLTSATENRSVTLTGRSKSLLPTVSNEAGQPLLKRKWMALVPALVIGCLALITYNTQLNSGLELEATADQADYRLDSRPRMIDKGDAALKKNGIAQKKRVLKSTASAIKLLPLAPKKSDSNEPDSVAVAEQRATASKSLVRNASARVSSSRDYTNPNTTTASRNIRGSRQSDPLESAQVSDLERELNRIEPR